MRTIRTSFLVLFVSVLGAVFAQAAVAYDAAEMYDPGEVVFVDLTLSAQAETELKNEPEEYVPGTFSLTRSSDGTPAGEEGSPVLPVRPVEVRLKGSVGGSFREITKKAAFKLKFKKADAVLGLRKMTLNNMVQDRSMIHETLAYASFRAAGVPASRTGYAYVRVNGEDFGLYLNLENLDDIALARIFGKFDDETQHLYEGEYGDDVVPGGAGAFEVDEGSEDELGDLEALIGAVNGSGTGPWSSRVAPYADLTEMTKMWAVEKYIDHWDGYSGHAIPTLRPNNYYLYSEPSGRFQMLPWGTDQAWIPTIGVGTPGREVTFDGKGGVLFNRCLEDAACRSSYWEALLQATSSIAAIEPSTLAARTAILLAPWQQEERDHGRPEFTAKEALDGVVETLDFIAARPAEANEWLAANAPPVKPTPVTPPAPSSRPTAPAGPLLFFLRSKQFPGFLTARLYLAEPGFVSVKARIKTPAGEKTICADRQHSGRPGPVVLHCKFSAEALHRLTLRALSLKLRMHLALPDGRLETIFRQIHLQRG